MYTLCLIITFYIRKTYFVNNLLTNKERWLKHSECHSGYNLDNMSKLWTIRSPNLHIYELYNLAIM